MEMLHTKIWYLWEVGFSFIKREKGDIEKGGMKYRPSSTVTFNPETTEVLTHYTAIWTKLILSVVTL